MPVCQFQHQRLSTAYYNRVRTGVKQGLSIQQTTVRSNIQGRISLVEAFQNLMDHPNKGTE